jgi:hypothetical protein
MDTIKQHFPQECSKENITDVQSVLNSLNTQNDILKAKEDTIINDAGSERGQGND